MKKVETCQENTQEFELDCGERVILRVGNCVVDVLAGYKEKRLLLEVYPFDSKLPVEGLVTLPKEQIVLDKL